jgi:hypothetical protein
MKAANLSRARSTRRARPAAQPVPLFVAQQPVGDLGRPRPRPGTGGLKQRSQRRHVHGENLGVLAQIL